VTPDEHGEGLFVTMIDETTKEFAVSRNPGVWQQAAIAISVDHCPDLAGQHGLPLRRSPLALYYLSAAGMDLIREFRHVAHWANSSITRFGLHEHCGETMRET
jgi:hypothetical protein